MGHRLKEEPQGEVSKVAEKRYGALVKRQADLGELNVHTSTIYAPRGQKKYESDDFDQVERRMKRIRTGWQGES